jgi:diadenosine tetraphosphate (Ap4A) HIT family hydrolase
MTVKKTASGVSAAANVKDAHILPSDSDAGAGKMSDHRLKCVCEMLLDVYASALRPVSDHERRLAMFCEFCQELTNPQHSRFSQMYAPLVNRRIVAEYGRFVAMPTIGQLFRGSLLILPRVHVETMASLSENGLALLDAFLMELKAVVSPTGPVVTFEHGARCTTGGGCGIYHAHVHLVPVPARVSAESLLSSQSSTEHVKHAPSLGVAFGELRSSDQYLLIRDSDGRVSFLEPSSASQNQYPSQYFRRVLADHFRCGRPWNWRAYVDREPDLLDTIQMFEAVDVSFSG